MNVGDAVTARMTEPTKLKDGTELPKGTHIVGKVTEIKLKADKEGRSKLGLLFAKAQLKDGKEVSLMLALVSVAPRWEPGGVDPVAADNGAASAGRISQMSQAAGRTEGSAGGDTLNKGLGVRGATAVSETAMYPGVSYLQDITIASYSMGEPGTILQSSKTTVYLDSGSRLLLLAQWSHSGTAQSSTRRRLRTIPPIGTPRDSGVPILHFLTRRVICPIVGVREMVYS